MKRQKILVNGKVQGVGFRAFTQVQAVRLGIKGWVRNLGYNQVEIEAEGEPEPMSEFVKLVGIGPPASRVDRLEIEELNPDVPLKSFEVRPSR